MIAIASLMGWLALKNQKPVNKANALIDSSPRTAVLQERSSDKDTTPSSSKLTQEAIRVHLQKEKTPENSYADALMLARCMAIGSDVDLPGDLTDAQKAKFKDSQLEGLDCKVLDTPYTLYDLASYAADNGVIDAQLNFAGLVAPMFNEEKAALDPTLIKKFKEDSSKYLQLAADSGHSAALGRLSESYSTGIFGDADPVKAYAYAYALDRISPGTYTRQRADQLLKELRADQISPAIAEGNKIANSFNK